jgi:hypothetical protein
MWPRPPRGKTVPSEWTPPHRDASALESFYTTWEQMRSVFEATELDSLSRRLRTLHPEQPARWGRMDARQMLCHIADQVRVGLGGLAAQRRRTPFDNPALRFVAVHLLPWPKGRIPTVPEMQSTKPGMWEEDLARAEALLHQAAQRGPDGPWAEHPAFGKMSGREWGWLVYKHTDHHLRQFGA